MKTKNETTINNKKEKLIGGLIKLVFEKAKKDSKKTNSYGMSRYLYKVLSEKISVRSFERHYRGYVQGVEKDRKKITDYNLDILSSYLGHENFKKFELKSECEIEKRKLRDEKATIENRLNKVKIIGWLISILFFIISTIFISKYYKKNCMIWIDDHYEKIRCSGLDMEESLDPVRLEKFRKVEVCEDSVFFKNGEPIKHYLRYNNEIEFFTYPGEHPVYDGKFVNEVTSRIIENYVKPCDSILKK